MRRDDSVFLSHQHDGDAGDNVTLSFSRSPTVLLQFAAGRFTRSASRIYQKNYGLGATDWRMLVMLTRVPGASVTESAETIGIDKAAVSRALKRLEDRGLVEQEIPEADARRKVWRLTTEGKAAHAKILKVALARQHSLLENFSAADIKKFSDYLKRFLENIEKLDAEHDA